MKFEDIKDLSLKELAKKRKAQNDLIFSAKMKNSIGQLSSPLEIRKLRRDFARISTAIRSLEIKKKG